jgi:hypothetical protein
MPDLFQATHANLSVRGAVYSRRLTAGNCRVARDRSRRVNRFERQHHWLMCELPDREHGAENENRIDHRFEQAALFLFRADQKGVSRFVVIHKVCLVDTYPYATTVPQFGLSI